MPFEIAVCDDSAIDRRQLIERIKKIKAYEPMLHFHEYEHGTALLEAMNQIRFSAIFLDVQMERIDGEKTAEEIRKIDNDVILVFNTGYAEPSPHSFEVQPYRYMKKNMNNEEQERYIMDVLEKMVQSETVPVLLVKCEGKKLYLRPNDIVYIEKCNKTTRAYISESAAKKHQVDVNQEFRISDKLEKLYHILEPYGFGYPHDSYIINFEYILGCTDKEFTLEGYENISFRFARSKAVEFKKQLQRFWNSKLEEIRRK
ncbi:MAG: response regulator transcription factor [Lachnospiraceae bacterium]|nr:response regulator transcription factor [Lachnospiraceae bacterium]